MNWYLAKIIFRIICGQGDHTPQFDEQLRLIAAEDDQHALIKAHELGRQESVNFSDQQQQMVEWKFVDVTEVYRVAEFMDGAELYSKIHETHDAAVYMELVHQRALFIKQHGSYTHLELLAHNI